MVICVGGLFFYTNEIMKNYDKPFRKPKDLVTHLQNKGLIIPDIDAAIKTLSQINYYRFKSYLFPLYDEEKNKYKPGSTFDNGLDLYLYDNGLRNDIFYVISRIEIKLRSILDQFITELSSDPFWYLDNKWFISSKINSIDYVRNNFLEKFNKTQYPFILHFKNNYLNSYPPPYNVLPPFWNISELSTFGDILIIYESLDSNNFFKGKNSILNNLPRRFGARNIKTFNSWLVTLKDIRNKCAHHSRLWNSQIPLPKDINYHLENEPSTPNRLYQGLVVLQIMLNNLEININLKVYIENHIESFPIVEKYLYSCGFNDFWKNEDIWK